VLDDEDPVAEQDPVDGEGVSLGALRVGQLRGETVDPHDLHAPLHEPLRRVLSERGARLVVRLAVLRPPAGADQDYVPPADLLPGALQVFPTDHAEGLLRDAEEPPGADEGLQRIVIERLAAGENCSW
jgi:hypothetical protein